MDHDIVPLWHFFMPLLGIVILLLIVLIAISEEPTAPPPPPPPPPPSPEPTLLTAEELAIIQALRKQRRT